MGLFNSPVQGVSKKRPSKHERQEHAGRVPQPGVPGGPRQTVAPLPSSPAYSPRTVRRTKERRKALVQRRRSALELLNKPPSYKPKTFHGKPTVGTPTLHSLRTFYKAGSLQTTPKGTLTTPKVRQVSKRLRTLQATQSSSKLKSPIVQTPEQQKVIRQVLSTGQKVGANRKEKLASVTAALQESGARNLPISGPGGGWRQEESAFYSPSEITNVKKGAKNFFAEAKTDTGGRRGRGETVAHLTQAIQGSGAGESYYKDNVPEAKSLLHQFNQGKKVPGAKRVEAQAKRLGLKLGPNAGKTVTIPGKGRYVFPFPGNKGWVWSRTDMGTDFAYTEEGAPIRALGSGVIVKTGDPFGYHGGFLLKLDQAKGLPSPYIYVYEGLDPTVSAGQRVKKGQLVGRGTATGSIEIGFATSSGETLAATEGTVDAESHYSPQGQAMTNFLHLIEQGRTRVPVRLLQAGGTLTPTSGGTVVTPSGTIEGTVPPGHGAGQRKQRVKKATAQQTFKKLKEVGVGTNKTEVPSESKVGSSELERLESRYGRHAA